LCNLLKNLCQILLKVTLVFEERYFFHINFIQISFTVMMSNFVRVSDQYGIINFSVV